MNVKKKKKVRCCLYLMYKKMTKPKGKTRNSIILKNQYQILAASNIFFFKNKKYPHNISEN